MPEESEETRVWASIVLLILGLGLIITGSLTSAGECGGATIVIEDTLSADELPENATVTDYQALEPGFKTAFRNAVEELNGSGSQPPKTFAYPSTPADSIRYVQYQDSYYEIYAIHGDCGLPEGVLLTYVPGAGLIAAAFIWFVVEIV